MLQKFGKRVMNNFGLKILAVLFAVVLWIVVVNIDDPSNSKPYTTSVSLENKSYITSMGKWADYLDGKNTITFSVYAKRSVHNTLTNANFTATADAQKIEYDEKTGTYRVPVTVTTAVLILPAKICIWILNWRILLQSSSRSRQTQPVRLRRDARLVMLRSQMRML